MTLRYGAVVGALASLRGRALAPELRPTETVRYRAAAARGIAPLADLYVPARPTGASVVLVHGGAFVIGSRRMKPMRFLASRLAGAGIAVCAIDYRLIFRGGRLDEAVADVCDAIAFWRARAPHHRLDADRVSLVGLSAGASLALLAAARGDPAQLASLACCFGLYELEQLRGVGGWLPRLLFRTTDRAVWSAGSPLAMPQPTVPTLVLHGTEDGLVSVEQARRLAAHRETLGLRTRLVIYPGAPHGFFNLPGTAAEAGVGELIAHVTQSR